MAFASAAELANVARSLHALVQGVDAAMDVLLVGASVQQSSSLTSPSSSSSPAAVNRTENAACSLTNSGEEDECCWDADHTEGRRGRRATTEMKWPSDDKAIDANHVSIAEKEEQQQLQQQQQNQHQHQHQGQGQLQQQRLHLQQHKQLQQHRHHSGGHFLHPLLGTVPDACDQLRHSANATIRFCETVLRTRFGYQLHLPNLSGVNLTTLSSRSRHPGSSADRPPDDGPVRWHQSRPSSSSAQFDRVDVSLGLFALLPLELQRSVFDHCDARSLATLATVCRAFRDLAADDQLWMRAWHDINDTATTIDEDGSEVVDDRSSELFIGRRSWRWHVVARLRVWKPGQVKNGPGTEYLKEEVAPSSAAGSALEKIPVRYSGDFKDDVRHGLGVFTDEKKNPSLYIGEWCAGQRHGFGTRSWANENSYRGQYNHDARDGYGTFRFANNSVFSGTFSQGKFQEGAYKWPNRRRYDGGWRDVFREGIGSYWWPDGRTYIGLWKGDFRSGKGVFCWPDGTQYEGKFDNGKRAGQGILAHTTADGRLHRFMQTWTEASHDDQDLGFGPHRPVPTGLADGERVDRAHGGGSRSAKTWKLPSVFTGETLGGDAESLELKAIAARNPSNLRRELSRQRVRRHRLAYVADGLSPPSLPMQEPLPVPTQRGYTKSPVPPLGTGVPAKRTCAFADDHADEGTNHIVKKSRH